MSILHTAIYTFVPKGVAVVRDLFIIKTMGLGAAAALMLSIIYISQFFGSLISSGFISEAVANRKHRNKRLVAIWMLLSIISALLFIPAYLINLLDNKFDDEWQIILAVVCCSILQSYIVIASSYFVANTKGSQSIYLLDAMPSIAVIAATIISPANIFTFSVMLATGLLISALIYNIKINQITETAFIKDCQTKKSFFKITRLTVFIGLMSVTNLVDIQLLGAVSMDDLAAFNFIQRYTVILASIVSLVAIRHFANKLNGKSIFSGLKEKLVHVVYLVACLVLYLLMKSEPTLNSYAAFALASLQIPSYILLTMILALNGHSLTFSGKIKTAVISVFAKYAFLVVFGVSIEIILVSHFLLNAIAHQMLKNEKK